MIDGVVPTLTIQCGAAFQELQGDIVFIHIDQFRYYHLIDAAKSFTLQGDTIATGCSVDMGRMDHSHHAVVEDLFGTVAVVPGKFISGTTALIHECDFNAGHTSDG